MLRDAPAADVPAGRPTPLLPLPPSAATALPLPSISPSNLRLRFDALSQVLDLGQHLLQQRQGQWQGHMSAVGAVRSALPTAACTQNFPASIFFTLRKTVVLLRDQQWALKRPQMRKPVSHLHRLDLLLADLSQLIAGGLWLRDLA